MNSSLFLATPIINRLAVLVVVISIIVLSVQCGLDVGYAQTESTKEKEDVFKVIVTLFGVEPTSGNIVSFVNIGNISKVKAFDAAKYYIPMEETATGKNSYNITSAAMLGSSNNVERSGIIELYYAFPNATSIKSGDEFRVCSMVVNDLRMICDTGVNTPALRAENVDMYLDTAQSLKVEDMKGHSMIKDDIEAVEDATGTQEEEEIVSEEEGSEEE
jgi:hypothetical protein